MNGVFKTYPGRILGFFNLDHSGSCENLMECIHVVVESSCDVVSMDTLSQIFVKKFKMPTTDKLGNYIYLVPISTISNPLCVYKNYGGRDHKFFCVLPQRKLSEFFSAQIGINNDSNLEETASIDDLGDSSSMNSDDDSFDYDIGGSTGVLDFGDSSDDSSQSTSAEE